MAVPSATSSRGVAFIAGFEGFAPRFKHDPIGIPTIGFGHAGALPPGFTEPLTRSQAAKLLAHDLRGVHAALNELPSRIQRQTRYDAVASLLFKVGVGLLDPHHDFGRAIRRPDRRGVPEAFLLYDHAGGKRLPGLTRRRQAERHLWLTGDYGDT